MPAARGLLLVSAFWEVTGVGVGPDRLLRELAGLFFLDTTFWKPFDADACDRGSFIDYSVV